MNLVGKISLGLAAAVMVSLVAWADDAVSADHPYATIAARNIFGLVPPPPVDPNPPGPPADPPPKITANGIMTILGQLQALFKVAAPAKNGQPAKEDSYMLTEGQRQDDIEVTKIDEKSATVTFDNHGTIQEIPLTLGQASGSSTAPGIGGPPQNPFGGPPGLPRFRPRAGFPGGFPGGPPGGPPGGIPAPIPSSNPNPLSAPGGGGGGGGAAYQPDQASGNLTPEQRIILIEAERARLQNSPQPDYNPALLPPTPLTPEPGAPGAQN